MCGNTEVPLWKLVWKRGASNYGIRANLRRLRPLSLHFGVHLFSQAFLCICLFSHVLLCASVYLSVCPYPQSGIGLMNILDILHRSPTLLQYNMLFGQISEAPSGPCCGSDFQSHPHVIHGMKAFPTR